MQKIRSLLHMEALGQSRRQMSRTLGMSRDTVADYLTRCAVVGLAWPIPEGMTDEDIELRVFPKVVNTARKPEPNWIEVHDRMRRKGATLMSEYEHYRKEHPVEGMARSTYFERYAAFLQTLRFYYRRTYPPGERCGVDYSGMTMTIVDKNTGQKREAQIFVGLLFASHYMYCEAHWSQKLHDWIAAHVRMFNFFGCVPHVLVCDNLKSGVIKASLSEPLVNETYMSLAEHYRTVVIPARSRHAKDKARVENGVKLVQRWILYVLHLQRRVFHSLEELNAALQELLAIANKRVFQKIGGTRESLFETVDRPAMQALPAQPFEYVEFARVRLGPDARFHYRGCEYNAPYQYAGQQIDLRVNAASVELLAGGRRIATHPLGQEGSPVVNPAYLPPGARYFETWTTEVDLRWAMETGEQVAAFLKRINLDIKFKEPAYRTGLAMRKLAKEYGAERLNAACTRGNKIGATTVQSIRTILKSRLDALPFEEPSVTEASFTHDNVRGPDYYH